MAAKETRCRFAKNRLQLVNIQSIKLVCELSRELSCVENEATLESRVLRDSQVRAYFARTFENGDNSLSTNSWFS